MESEHKRVCAYINLENIVHNLSEMKKRLGDDEKQDTRIIAVIKANGYGHGAVAIANRLETVDFVYGYAVAAIDEAVILREAGIKKPILILGYVFTSDIPLLIKHKILPTVFTYEDAKEISDACVAAGVELGVHIKIDTGMHRIGFLCNAQAIEDIVKISQLKGIYIDGIFTHFSRADEYDRKPTEDAYRAFKGIVDALKERGVKINRVHCCNSAGIIDYPQYKSDLVRAGITMYGLWPSNEVSKDIDLRPALSLVSHISHIKVLEKGEPISYGGTYVTDKTTTVATVPVGYGDGYPRSLSNKGYVLIGGKKAPIVGRVCMDQFMVDITGLDTVKKGDRVVLIGQDEELCITCEELGELSGRFNYELVCDLNQRIPRITE